MSNEPAASGRNSRLRCPACRARQPVQTVCRRCGADLELLTRALTRLDEVRSALAEATERGNDSRQRELTEELRLLRPASLPEAAPRQAES